MPQLSRLPIELHSEILKHALYISENLPSCMIEHWSRTELLSIWSRFPYNAFMTCTLWRDLLERMPCWEFIIFNVANNPAPLLNAFEWSASLTKIDLVVFTSDTEGSQISKDLESKRVSAIVDCLKPHIHRCESIAFDVMYEESFPSSLIFFNKPVPRLSKHKLAPRLSKHNLIELKLECRVPKVIRHSRDYDLRVPKFLHFSACRNMINISINGQGFIKLCLFRGVEWMHNLKNLNSLRIANLLFFDGDNESNCISVHNFAHCLSQLKSLRVLRFKDFSIKDRNHAVHNARTWGNVRNEWRALSRIRLRELEFDDTSKNFQSEFFAYAKISAESKTFSQCVIPRICQPFLCRSLEVNFIIPDKSFNEKGVWESSLQCVLVAFPGTTLIVRSCSLFDDDLLNWLSTEVDYTPFSDLPPNSFDTDSIVYHTFTRRSPAKTFPSENIKYLDLYDCENYSFETLRKLVEIRKKSSLPGKINTEGIVEMRLMGRHPEFSPDDVNWLLGQSESLKLVKPDGQVFEDIDVRVTFE